MKKLLIGVLVIVLIGLGWFLLNSADREPAVVYTEPGADAIAGTGALSAYTIKGEPTGGGTLTLSFSESATAGREYSLLNVALDLDGDGQYSAGEWVVRNQVRLVESGARDNSQVDLPSEAAGLPDELAGVARFSTDDLAEGWWSGEGTQEVAVTVSPYELNDILGLDVPGNGPGVYRGFADGFAALAPAAGTPGLRPAPTAYAQGLPVVNVDSELDIGDIRQSNMECAPTSITNNLQALAEENGVRDDLPSADQMIDQLKEDMKFGDEGKDGILDKNYIAGKNAFVLRYNLPIVTTEISNPSIEDIANAIEEGAVVEMDLAFIDVAAGNAHVASHVVTLTGVSSDGSSATLRGRDSATPEGSESWQFFPKREGQALTQMHYPLWKSATLVNKIYIQRYVTVDEAVTAGVLPEGAVGSTYPVEMFVIGDSYYPKAQFAIGNNPEDECKAPHYHKHTTAFGLRARTGTDIAQANDPASDNCGFGKVSDVPVETLRLTWEQQQALAGALSTP